VKNHCGNLPCVFAFNKCDRGPLAESVLKARHLALQQNLGKFEIEMMSTITTTTMEDALTWLWLDDNC